MSADDQQRWDTRYAAAPPPQARVPELFAGHEDLFPTSGSALDIACGSGAGSLWLAQRGLQVTGLDVSSVAIDAARSTARGLGLADQCKFETADFDYGLPPQPPVDLVMCHRFRAPALYQQMIDQLKPGGLLALAVLSEVESEPGPYRARAGELRGFFAKYPILVDHEGAGSAVLIVRSEGHE